MRVNCSMIIMICNKTEKEITFMKKIVIFAKASRQISAVLITAILITMLFGCSVIPQKSCDHNYYLADYAEATSSGNGYKKFTCSSCGNFYQEVTPAKEASIHEEERKNNSDIPEEITPDLTRKRSVKLFDLPIYSDLRAFSGGVDRLHYISEEADVDGWKHSDCYKICGSSIETWVRYELNGKYTVLSGKLYAARNFDNSAWLEFYDGEEFLAATPKLSDSATSIEFEIDISGVDYLTVHFCSDDSSNWMIADDIVLTK